MKNHRRKRPAVVVLGVAIDLGPSWAHLEAVLGPTSLEAKPAKSDGFRQFWKYDAQTHVF